MNKKLRLLGIGLVIAALTYVLIINHQMRLVAEHIPHADADVMIILGAKLNGATFSLALKSRMEVALDYLKQNSRTQVVVSGGQGQDESIPEAAAMRDYLILNKINSARILIDNQSTNTFENIAFSKKLIHGKDVLLVSNDFHLLRAKMIAARQGLNVDTLAAPTPRSVKFQLFAREYIAIIKSYLFDR
ncbi:MAG: hypothetical protein JWM44_2038 [Bacilli bacterium]|nr:hypothetical protein [Bacilli bacterium]